FFVLNVGGITYAVSFPGIAPDGTTSTGGKFSTIFNKILASGNYATDTTGKVKLATLSDTTSQIGTLIAGKWCKTVGGKIECTSNAPTGSSNDCLIITPANSVACHNALILSRATGYDGHGFNLRDSYPYYMYGNCNLDGVTLAHPGYRFAWPAGAAIVLKNVNGRLWAYGKNFPTHVWGASGWWLGYSGQADMPLCDLSETLQCTTGMFEPAYLTVSIDAGLSGITTSCGTYGGAVSHTYDF
ncbi:MAG: hypothetical protein PHH70_02325, partial [Candidatus Gracilibacteria bacterium]|nr:hypothetical protein [Candidatus Gracilibacteria bacterium]